MPEKLYRYTVVFEPAEEGGFIAVVPALPGVATQGDSLEEARANARDAIKCYLESLAEDGLPIPTEPTPTNVRVRQEVEVELEHA